MTGPGSDALAAPPAASKRAVDTLRTRARECMLRLALSSNTAGAELGRKERDEQRGGGHCPGDRALADRLSAFGRGPGFAPRAYLRNVAGQFSYSE